MTRTIHQTLAFFGLLGIVISTGVAGEPRCDSPKDRMERAGNANCIAPWARCTNGAHQVGYYVGGGAHFNKGEPRYPLEGVWGVDAQPIIPGFRQAVVLSWWHGPKFQGGPGAYEPDHHNRPFDNFRKTRHAAKGTTAAH